MKVHAQSTTTLAESRPPYIHLGYLAATSPLDAFKVFVPGVIVFLAGYLIVVKFDYGWLFDVIAGLFSRFGILKALGVILSSLLLLGVIIVYCFTQIFN